MVSAYASMGIKQYNLLGINMKKLLAMLLLTVTGAANAALVTYDWTWTGTVNNAKGTMSYSDVFANTGVITGENIAGFTIQGYTGDTLRFDWDLATGTQNNPFRLSFDTTAKTLVFGGFYPTAMDSVVWGNDAVGALVCGSGSCGFYGNGVTFDGVSVSNKAQFSFTPAAAPVEVPEPAGILLLGIGIAGIWMSRKKVNS